VIQNDVTYLYICICIKQGGSLSRCVTQTLFKLGLPSFDTKTINLDSLVVCTVLICYEYILIYNINKVTTGNDFRLSKNRSHCDLRKFRSLIVNVWNSLPNAVVDVDSFNLFKSTV